MKLVATALSASSVSVIKQIAAHIQAHTAPSALDVVFVILPMFAVMRTLGSAVYFALTVVWHSEEVRASPLPLQRQEAAP